MNRLNKNGNKIQETVLGMGMMLRFMETSIHDSCVPINDFYWEFSRNIDDKCINMDNFKYIHYSDPINMKIWAFKRN